MQQAAQEDRNLGLAADWEHKTDARIESNATAARLEALRAERTAAIDARRAMLAAKLASEEAASKEEMLVTQQTPAQRRAAMADRARMLAAKREAERQVCTATIRGGCGGSALLVFVVGGSSEADTPVMQKSTLPKHHTRSSSTRPWLRSCWMQLSGKTVTP